MARRSWKVYGRDGHRQAISFNKSFKYDFSDTRHGVRIIEVDCADKTGTHDYVIVRITRDDPVKCREELLGQLSDGIFENCYYGIVEEITNEPCEADIVIDSVILRHGADDLELWQLDIPDEAHDQIMDILQKYSMTGCSVRGTKRQIADEIRDI